MIGRISKFQGGMSGTIYKCRCCGKRTRETGEGESGVQLCADCYDAGGRENAHADGYHREDRDGPDPDCPLCSRGG